MIVYFSLIQLKVNWCMGILVLRYYVGTRDIHLIKLTLLGTITHDFIKG